MAWNLASHGSIEALLEAPVNTCDGPRAPGDLSWTPFDQFLLQSSYTRAALIRITEDMLRATSHSEVESALTRLSQRILMDLDQDVTQSNQSTLPILFSLSWKKSFER